MLKSERGLTLIEILMSLAITALLATAILFGRDQLRVKQQFSQGVDQLVETIANTRNQATSTVGQAGAGGTGGGTGTEAIYGKLMEIKPNGSIDISTETINGATDGSGGAVVNDHVDLYTVQIPWTVASPSYVNLLFGLQEGGSINAYASIGSGHVPIAPTSNKNNQMAVLSTPFTFPVTDSHGNTAHIKIDLYGNVSRSYP